jgi:hypothetical protein
MHTNDILAFVHDHFSEVGDDAHVQWIDDTSANVVFKDNDTAKRAHLTFLSVPVSIEEILNNPFELRAAKQLSSRPSSQLMVRVAQQGDRKKKGAREASRYYLLHPDQDPTERMRKEFENTRGDYRRRRFDDRELHRRRGGRYQDPSGGDPTDNFSANMYDDTPATDPENNNKGRGRDLFSRVSKGRRRSASPGARTRNSDEIDISDSDSDGRTRPRNYRDRGPPRVTNAGKELFSSTSSPRAGGGLRSDRLDLFPSKTTDMDTSMSRDAAAPSRPMMDTANQIANAAAAKRLKADLLNAAQTSPRSLHRRSHAMDAKNAEDLSERFARKSISIDSTKSARNGALNAGVELFPSNGGGLSIKGASDGMAIKGAGGLSIKGRALEVKELFPNQYQRGTGGPRNEGKELFDEPVREKRVRRRAGDLFD